MPTTATSSARSSTTNSKIFYELLGYPLPANAEFFENQKKGEEKNPATPEFSSPSSQTPTRAKTLAEFAREIQRELQQKSDKKSRGKFKNFFFKKTDTEKFTENFWEKNWTKFWENQPTETSIEQNDEEIFFWKNRDENFSGEKITREKIKKTWEISQEKNSQKNPAKKSQENSEGNPTLKKSSETSPREVRKKISKKIFPDTTEKSNHDPETLHTKSKPSPHEPTKNPDEIRQNHTDPQKLSQKKHTEMPGPRRQQLNPHTATALRKICELRRLRPNIPFVDAVFLCDGHSFNAGKPNSDIDLFFLTRPGALRRARFFSVLIFRSLGIKRSFTQKSEKFDLIFYRTSDALDLDDFTVEPHDIYLQHRILHLQPIRSTKTRENQKLSEMFFQENQKLSKKIPPERPTEKQEILGRNRRSSLAKLFIEKIVFAKIREKIIATPRKRRITQKSKHRKTAVKNIKISATTLAFHHDIREKIQAKFKEKTKSYHNHH